MAYIIIITIAFIVGTLCYSIDEIITNSYIFKEYRKKYWENVITIKMWLGIIILLCSVTMLITGIIGIIVGFIK